MNRLYCGLPVRDRAAALEWYETFFGRPADEIVGTEALWEIRDPAWVYVDEHPDRAGGAMLTVEVDDLDEVLKRLTEHRIAHEPVETYADGVRHVTVVDPDGNRLSLAAPPPHLG